MLFPSTSSLIPACADGSGTSANPAPTSSSPSQRRLRAWRPPYRTSFLPDAPLFIPVEAGIQDQVGNPHHFLFPAANAAIQAGLPTTQIDVFPPSGSSRQRNRPPPSAT